MSKNDMQNEIVTLLGGRVAEKLILGDITTGASNDIQRATSIARNMVTKYGMSDELGPIVFGSEHGEDEVFLGRDFSTSRNYSEETASKIDAEIKGIVEAAYNKAVEILQNNTDKLHFIAGFLFKNELMDEVQFEAVMTGNPTVEELEAMVEEKRRRSAEENAAKKKRDEEEQAKREEEERIKEEERRKQQSENRNSDVDAFKFFMGMPQDKDESEKDEDSDDDEKDE